jgi:hypothetical protein
MDLKQIYYDLGNAVKGICDVVIARNRPDTVDKRYDSFIVVSLPYAIRNNEISDDGSYNDYSTTVQISIYTRNRVSSSLGNCTDLDAMDEKLERVLSVFPIRTPRIIVTKPKVILQTDDGDGFDITMIQGRLRTR